MTMWGGGNGVEIVGRRVCVIGGAVEYLYSIQYIHRGDDRGSWACSRSDPPPL